VNKGVAQQIEKLITDLYDDIKTPLAGHFSAI
jgi:hypothetical protein